MTAVSESDSPAVTAATLALQAKLTATRWAAVVVKAHKDASVYQAVMKEHAAGMPMRPALRLRGEGLHWSTFRHWLHAVADGQGQTWERLLDHRCPRPAEAIDSKAREMAVQMRKTNPGITAQKAREILATVFGDGATYSDAWLRRVWKSAGVNASVGAKRAPVAEPKAPVADSSRPAPSEETVEILMGGAGLALLAAADAETRASLKLAKAIRVLGQECMQGEPMPEQRDPTAGRDGHGQFTAEYNQAWRVDTPQGEPDGRWSSDAEKREARPLGGLRVLQVEEMTLARKLLAMGTSPMVTERRGFDGLSGPSGAWMAGLGGPAYMPATLDKALTELGSMDADGAMWPAHARQWHEMTIRWSGDKAGWLQTAVYIDGTADPYWTRAFAKAGKVSRAGRVMPCLSRVALNSAAGIPLLVTTEVGAAPLCARIIPMLRELREAIGPEAQADRLVVIDSEAGNAAMLLALHEEKDTIFIVPIKGNAAKGIKYIDQREWEPVRTHDRVREVSFYLGGTGPEKDIEFWGVQLDRPGGRRAQPLLLACNGAEGVLSAVEVATEYLARWPRQEQVFREVRDGGGLNHSHGYGGSMVLHIAAVAKRAKASHRLDLAQARVEKGKATQAAVGTGAAVGSENPSLVAAARSLAGQQQRVLVKKAAARAAEASKALALPDTIWHRDTGRDSVMTCLKLMTLGLLEFVLHEYFGGLEMQWRSYIEDFVALPVTVVTTATRQQFRITENPRQPERMAQLRKALAEINRRELSRGGKRLTFELIEPTRPGP